METRHLWHIYGIDNAKEKQKRLGAVSLTKESVANLIGSMYELESARYIVVAAFSLKSDGSRSGIWNPGQRRHIYDHEIHCLFVPDDMAN